MSSAEPNSKRLPKRIVKRWGAESRLGLASYPAPTTPLSPTDPEGPAPRGGVWDRLLSVTLGSGPEPTAGPELLPAPHSEFLLNSTLESPAHLLRARPRPWGGPLFPSDWPQSLSISQDAAVACRGPALFREP